MVPVFPMEIFSPVLSVILSLHGLWMIWYFVKFKLIPFLCPNEPKEYPYLIPVIGHIVPFYRNHDKLYSDARKYFGNTREPFCVTIMGQSQCIITSATDVSAIYKLPKALSIEPFIHDIMMSFGIPKKEVDTMFQKGFAPSGKSYMDVSHDHFKMQLHPGEKLKIVEEKILSITYDSMRWEKLQGHIIVDNPCDFESSNSKSEIKTVSLYRWTQDSVVDATTRSFWDDKLYEIAPDLLSMFRTFEEESWKLPFQPAPLAAKRLHTAKNYLEGALKQYLELPEDQLPNESWLVRQLDHNMKELGLDRGYSGRGLFPFFRTANSNAYKSTFWMLTRILFDSELLAEVRYEIKPASDASGRLILEYLLDSCPLLNSIYEEVLRIYNCPLGIRTALEPSVIGGKLLRPGKTIMMVYRQLHHDETIWGDDAGTFDPKRFMKNPGLAKSTSFRPFGGSTSWCPGRFLARREVLLFVAAALKRFDIEIVPNPGQETVRFPRPDDGLPSGGLYAPLLKDDLTLKLTPIRR